ncbi:GntR family transcriptional regulator [Herbidospora yilanensis]|uniref:GntR family transcriptional regulator n=1 Tax=Herbidospora yilanensis TaxID=354426 RepID=UPI0007844E4B|nr:GntR family transcriptional regulator [Herbidospora yilanensis]
MPAGADTRALYERVADDLRAAIVRGELKPGDNVPAEQELAANHQVSRQTVRQALQQLTNEGLLSSGRGRGRVVRSQTRLRWQLSSFESTARHNADGDAWNNDVRTQGHEPRQEVTVGIDTASPKVAQRLGVSEDDLVVVRRRVRYVDDMPFQLSDSYFPMDIAQGTVLMKPGDIAVPGGILSSIGHPQVKTLDEIQVRMPTKDETTRLGLPAGTPIAEHTRTGYDADGRPVRVMVSVLPGDRHVMVYELDAT